MKPPYKSKNVQKKAPLRESKRSIDRKTSIVKVPVLNLEPSVADVEKIYSDLVTKKEAYAEHFEKPSFLSRLKRYTKKALSNRGVQLALGVATVGLALTLREQFKKYKEKEKALLQAVTICDFFNDNGAFKSDVFEVQDFENKRANLIRALESQVSMVKKYISDQTSSWNTTIHIEEDMDIKNFFPQLRDIELQVGKLNVEKLNKINEYKHPSSFLNLLEPFNTLIVDVNLFMRGIDELKKNRNVFSQYLVNFKIIVSCRYKEGDEKKDIEEKLKKLSDISISQEKIFCITILYQNEQLTLNLTKIIDEKESIISNLKELLIIIEKAKTAEEAKLLISIQERKNTVNKKRIILDSILSRFDNNDVKEEELVNFEEEEELETRGEKFNIDLESINKEIEEYNGLVNRYNSEKSLYLFKCETFKNKVIEINKVTKQISSNNIYTYTQSQTLKENDEALKFFISKYFSGKVITDSFFQGDIKTLTYLHDTEIQLMTNMIDIIREKPMKVFYDFLESKSESFKVELQLQEYYSKDSKVNIELYSALRDAVIKSAIHNIHNIKSSKTIISKEERWNNDVYNILEIKKLSEEIDSVYKGYKLEDSITEYIKTNIKNCYEELFENAVFVKIEDKKIEIFKSTVDSSNSIKSKIFIDESDLKKKYDEFETRLYIFLASKLLWKGLRDEKNKCDSILQKQKINPNLASFVDSVIEKELKEEFDTYEKDESSNNFMSATFTEEYLTKIQESLQSFQILQGKLNSTVEFMEAVDSFYKEKSKWPLPFLFGNKNILEELFEKVKSHLNSLVPSPLVYDFVPKSYLGPFKSYLEPVPTVDKKFIEDVESLIVKIATLSPEKTKHMINPNFLSSLIFLLNITQQDVSSLSNESTTQILKILFSIYSKIIMDVVNEKKVHGFKYKDKVIIKDLPSEDNDVKNHLLSLTEALIEMVFDDYSEFKKFSTSTFIFPLHESKFTSFSDVERQKLIDFTENCIYISSYEKDFITLDLKELIDMGSITQRISDKVKPKLSTYIREAKNILMLKDSQTDSLKKVEKITKVIKEMIEVVVVEKGHEGLGLGLDVPVSYTPRRRNWSKDLITSYQSKEPTHLILDKLLFLDSFIHTRSLMEFIVDKECTESPESCYAEIHKQVKTPLYTELENKRKKYNEVKEKSYDTNIKWISTQFGFISDQFNKIKELFEIFNQKSQITSFKDYKEDIEESQIPRHRLPIDYLVTGTLMPMYNNVSLKEEAESLNESISQGDQEESAKTIDEAAKVTLSEASEATPSEAEAEEAEEAAKAKAVDNFIQSSSSKFKEAKLKANEYILEIQNSGKKRTETQNKELIEYIPTENGGVKNDFSIRTIYGDDEKVKIIQNEFLSEEYKGFMKLIYMKNDKINEIFIGYFSENSSTQGLLMMNGYGEYYYHDENTIQYKGYYKNGKRDGIGISYSSDGKNISYSGYWSKGKEQEDISILSKYDIVYNKDLPISFKKNDGGYTILQLPTGLDVFLLEKKITYPVQIQYYDGLKYSFIGNEHISSDQYFGLESIIIDSDTVNIIKNEINKTTVISSRKSRGGGKITQKKIKTKQKRSSSKKMVFKHLGARNLVV
jgi:hypothetical protein